MKPWMWTAFGVVMLFMISATVGMPGMRAVFDGDPSGWILLVSAIAISLPCYVAFSLNGVDVLRPTGADPMCTSEHSSQPPADGRALPRVIPLLLLVYISLLVLGVVLDILHVALHTWAVSTAAYTVAATLYVRQWRRRRVGTQDHSAADGQEQSS